MPYARCGCHYELGKGVLHSLSCIQKASAQIAARDTNWRRDMTESNEEQQDVQEVPSTTEPGDNDRADCNPPETGDASPTPAPSPEVTETPEPGSSVEEQTDQDDASDSVDTTS